MPSDVDTLTRSVTEELIDSVITLEDQIELADRLGVSWGEVEQFVAVPSAKSAARGTRRWSANELAAKIEKVVRSSLDIVFSTAPIHWAEVQRLALRRVYFETIMAWSINAAADRRARLRDQVSAIQEQLWELAQTAEFSDAVAEHGWQLDGDFHRKICEISGYDHVAQVVDMVIKKCKRWGIPDLASDVRGTWEEHEEIIEAITDNEGDRDRILSAIRRHVDQAAARWQAKEGRMENCVGSPSWQEDALQWLVVRDQPIIDEGEDTFLRELPELLRSHRGEWVAYRGSSQLGFGHSKFMLWKSCEQRGFPVAEVLVRKVAPRILTSVEGV
jgi:hypothetical protein